MINRGQVLDMSVQRKSYVSVWVQSVAKTFSFSHAEVTAGADLGVMYTCVLAPAVAGLGLIPHTQ